MFDVSIVNRRYFTIKLNEIVIEVEPPKVKILKKIAELSKSNNQESISDLTEAVRIILSKNKTGYKVPEEVIEELDFDQLQAILTAYFEWLIKEKKSKN